MKNIDEVYQPPKKAPSSKVGKDTKAETQSRATTLPEWNGEGIPPFAHRTDVTYRYDDN